MDGLSGIASFRMMPSPEQMRTEMEKRFNGLDVNGDGSLDKSEFESFIDDISQRTGKELDAIAAFEQFDTDQNGTIDSDEMRESMKEFGEKNGIKPLGPPPIPPFGISSDKGMSTAEFLKLMAQMKVPGSSENSNQLENT